MIAYPQPEEQLTSEQLYHRELASLPDAKALSQQEKDAIIAQARTGDRQAREMMITSLLQRIATYCRRYYAAYSWASPHLCYLDLVQAGNMAVLEYVDQVLASDHPNPYAYLTVTAYSVVRQYAKRYSSMVVTPLTPDAHPLPVASLDAPLRGEGEGTLADLVAETLASEMDALQEPSQTLDYGPLYEALDTLGEGGRTMIVQHYGLFDHAPTSLRELGQSLFRSADRASGTHLRVLNRLHQLLRNAYAQFCPSLIRPPLRRPGVIAEEKLSEGQRARLEQAHRALLARGEKVTIDRLRREAHIADYIARTYLRQWEAEHPQETTEQRLARVYQELEAEYGERFSAERLAQRARVQFAIASGYLQLQRGPKLSQEERMMQAYQQMKAQGEKITIPALSQRSHVDGKKVQSWLTAQRIAEGLRPIRKGGVTYWVSAEAETVSGHAERGVS